MLFDEPTSALDPEMIKEVLDTMIELAEAVLDLTGSSSQLTYKPLPEDDPKQRQPDITLARETLGWAPQVALRDGLGPTIAYFDGLLKAGFA